LGVEQLDSMPDVAPGQQTRQDNLFEEAFAIYGAALERLARAYEAEREARRDLLQEIHIALWRSFAGFDNRCSLRTWVYRVAHNTAASHVNRQLRMKKQPVVGLEELTKMPERAEGEEANAGRRHSLDRIFGMIQKLGPLDRQVMLAYLEGIDAASTAEITGLSARNVATKIHRIKNVLARQFREGGRDGQ
jgi:RNA polymerase sigma-70 factor (ECF subfamily)